MSQTTESNAKTNAFKKLDNNGHNYYSMWALRCQMVLQGLELWDIINPAAQSSTWLTPAGPTAPAPMGTSSASATVSIPASTPEINWDRKNSKALSQLSTCIDNTPLHLISVKTTARDAWQALADHYNGIGALDASILLAHLH